MTLLKEATRTDWTSKDLEWTPCGDLTALVRYPTITDIELAPRRIRRSDADFRIPVSRVERPGRLQYRPDYDGMPKGLHTGECRSGRTS